VARQSRADRIEDVSDAHGASLQRDRQDRLGNHGSVDRSSAQRADHLRERHVDEVNVLSLDPLPLEPSQQADVGGRFGASMAIVLPTRSPAVLNRWPFAATGAVVGTVGT
jgi:hypothetical protein